MEYKHWQKKILIASFICMGLFSLLAAVNIAQAGLVESVDQAQEASDWNWVFDDDEIATQEFAPSLDTLTSVEVVLLKTGSPLGYTYVEIKDMADNSLGLQRILSDSVVFGAWHKFTFNTPIVVDPGVKYKFFVYTDTPKITGGGDAYLSFPGLQVSDYDCGVLNCVSNHVGIFPDHDYRFRTYGYDAQIFTDGFESGNLSAWSSIKGAVTADGYEALACQLCVGTTGALIDSYSLKVRVPNNNAHFVQDDTPNAETEYHARFKIKRGKTLKMGNLNNFKLMLAKNGTQTPFFLQVRRKGLKFQIRGVAKEDHNFIKKTAWTILPKTAAWVEIGWAAASAPGANDGFLKLYVNDLLKTEKLGLDNDTFAVELVRLGVAAKFKPTFTISGAFKLDGFSSNKAYSWVP